MYAIFLLVLLADVARAKTLAPLGLDATGSSNLTASPLARIARTERTGPTARSIRSTRSSRSARGVLAGVNAQLSSLSAARTLSRQFFSTDRTAPKRHRSSVSEITRGMLGSSYLDGPHFATGATFALLTPVDAGFSLVSQSQPYPASRTIPEHTASPAP